MKNCPSLSCQEFLLKCGEDERDFVKDLDRHQKRLQEVIRAINILLPRTFGLFVFTNRGFKPERMGNLVDRFAKAADMLEKLHGKLEKWNGELEKTAREIGSDA